MRRRLVLATLLAAALPGCVVSPTSPPSGPASPAASATPSGTGTPSSGTSAPFTLAGLPVIDGSTANIPLISLVVQRLTGVSATEADNAVQTTGTSSAYERLVAGQADVLIVYEPDKETLKTIAESGVQLESRPIGRDALVFFTNASNPVRSLTTSQYRDVYTGKLTNWSAVGGKDVKIVAYQRPEDSGSQALLRKYVVGDAKLAKAPTEQIAGEMGEIIDKVSSYANTGNALGYSVYYYLANMYAVPGIRMLGVAGVQPSKATLADGTYPYVNDFQVVIRADAAADSPARRVFDWMTSADGTQAVVDAGYVPKS